MTEGTNRTVALLVAALVCAAGGWCRLPARARDAVTTAVGRPTGARHDPAAAGPGRHGDVASGRHRARVAGPQGAEGACRRAGFDPTDRRAGLHPTNRRTGLDPTNRRTETGPTLRAPPGSCATGASTGGLVRAHAGRLHPRRLRGRARRLAATSNVAVRPSQDGTALAVATPRADRSTGGNPTVVAVVAALTGVVAAAAIVLLWRPGRRGRTGLPTDPMRGDGLRPAVPDVDPVPVGAGLPMGTGGRPPVPPGTVARRQAPLGPPVCPLCRRPARAGRHRPVGRGTPGSAAAGVAQPAHHPDPRPRRSGREAARRVRVAGGERAGRGGRPEDRAGRRCLRPGPPPRGRHRAAAGRAAGRHGRSHAPSGMGGREPGGRCPPGSSSTPCRRQRR